MSEVTEEQARAIEALAASESASDDWIGVRELIFGTAVRHVQWTDAGFVKTTVPMDVFYGPNEDPK